MNTFNRIFMTLLGLIIFAFGVIPFLLLTGLVTPGRGYLRDILALYNAWRAVALLRGATTNIAVLVPLILMVIGLVLIVLELLPLRRAFSPRTETKQYVVRDDALWQAVRPASSAAQPTVAPTASFQRPNVLPLPCTSVAGA